MTLHSSRRFARCCAVTAILLGQDFGPKKSNPVPCPVPCRLHGRSGLGPPCCHANAPNGHVFTVYALDVAALDLDASAMPALVGYMLNAHAIAKASLMAYYGR
ncbi:MAG: hypothetical protein IE886_04590 [Campylobacterales bacterium]|nr:hypothetical protein [Campylobacterales bacterium]